MKCLQYIKPVLIAGLFIVSSMAFSANDVQSLEQANECYRNNQFELASKKYESILNNKMASSDLYFNLGNSYYKQGKIPQAILNYERALILNPSDLDVKFNLKQAQQFVVDKIEPSYTPFMSKEFNRLISLQSVDNWAWFSVTAFLLFLLFLAVYFFGRTRWQKKLGFYIGSLAFICFIFLFTLAYSANDRFVSQKAAIVFAPSVTIRSAPSAVSKQLFVLHEGTKVKILENDADWFKIQLPNNSEGWLKKESIEII